VIASAQLLKQSAERIERFAYYNRVQNQTMLCPFIFLALLFAFIRVICGLSPLQKLRPANHADIRERLTIEFRLPIPIALPHPTRSRQARLSKPMGLVNQSTQAIHGSSHHEAG
jgi:hypothetical protein